VWIALVIVFLACIVSAAVAGGGTATSVSAPLERNGVKYTGTIVQNGDSNKTIAVIPIRGTIVNGDSSADGSTTGGDDIVRMLDAVIEDKDRFAGVLLELNTGGGAVLASAEMEEAVRRVQKEAKLPVVAWMRDAAASGGYYVSAPADRIIAAPQTFTGSIGVILEYYEFSGLADKYGVTPVVIKSGKLKDIGAPFKKISAEERAVLQSVIDEAFDDFVGVVAKGRGLSEAKVREIADGRIYTGRQGKANGLVDEIGMRREAYAAMAKLVDAKDVQGEDLDVVEFGRSYSIFESLSAGAQPTLASLSAAKAAGGILRGEGLGAGDVARATGSRSMGNGLASVEYRAAIG